MIARPNPAYKAGLAGRAPGQGCRRKDTRHGLFPKEWAGKALFFIPIGFFIGWKMIGGIEARKGENN